MIGKESNYIENVSDEERREYTRVPLNITMEVLPIPENKSVADITPLICICRDISEGGISFYTTKRYPAESLMRLHIPLNNAPSSIHIDEKKSLDVVGKIMWCKKNGETGSYVVGFQFLNIYEQDHHILNEYVMGVLEN